MAIWTHSLPRVTCITLCAINLASGDARGGDTSLSIARLWNEQQLQAITLDETRPPIHARNLYHVAAAMYDAWAALLARWGQCK
jgi:hypothetical protein